jgi:hypothetical protein
LLLLVIGALIWPESRSLFRVALQHFSFPKVCDPALSRLQPVLAVVVGNDGCRWSLGGTRPDIAGKIDAAFFGPAPATDSIQPGGLEYLGSSVTEIDADLAAGIDAYIDALAAAEGYGLDLTAFVVGPTTAQALAKLTASEGSSQKLFGQGLENGISRSVLGLPLVVSPYVAPGTAWGIPAARTYAVLRSDVTLEVDRSVFFTRDQTAVRAILRVGFGLLQPSAIIKIRTTS